MAKITVQKPLLSFVLPVYNEEGCIETLYERICRAVETLGVNFEMIWVNDCSTDGSLNILRRLHERDPRAKIISFSRNFGHQVAVVAGLHHAKGDAVIVMDTDLQDPPELAVPMVERWRDGYQVVYGVRKSRQETWIKRVLYRFFYRLLRFLSPLRIPLDAGDFCLMDASVVRVLRTLQEDRPFVRGLRFWAGFRQTGIEYDRPPRFSGETKYSFRDLFTLAFDGLLSFSDMALKVSIVTGFIISLLSVSYALYVVAVRILAYMGVLELPPNVMAGWTTIVAGLLFLMGLQFIFLGVIGEYVGRIFMQVKRRPLYVIEETIGIDHAAID